MDQEIEVAACQTPARQGQPIELAAAVAIVAALLI